MTVASILKQKNNDIASVAPYTPISDVATLLSQRRIGAVLVLDAAGALAGIVSERDIIHCLAAHGAGTLDMTAGQVMTRTVRTAERCTSVAEVMSMMTAGRFRHIPVLENGALVGIVSIGDAVKARLEQQAQEVDSLRAYVSGG